MSYTNNKNQSWSRKEDPPKSTIKFILDRVPGIILEPNPVIIEGQVIQPELTESLERVRHGIATAYSYYKPFLDRNENENGYTTATTVKNQAKELLNSEEEKPMEEWFDFASNMISHMIDIRFLKIERTFPTKIDIRTEDGDIKEKEVKQ